MKKKGKKRNLRDGEHVPSYIPLGLGTCVTLRSPSLMSQTHRRRASPTSFLNPSWLYSHYAALMAAIPTLAVYPPSLLPPSPSPVSSVSYSVSLPPPPCLFCSPVPSHAWTVTTVLSAIGQIRYHHCKAFKKSFISV